MSYSERTDVVHKSAVQHFFGTLADYLQAPQCAFTAGLFIAEFSVTDSWGRDRLIKYLELVWYNTDIAIKSRLRQCWSGNDLPVIPELSQALNVGGVRLMQCSCLAHPVERGLMIVDWGTKGAAMEHWFDTAVRGVVVRMRGDGPCAE